MIDLDFEFEAQLWEWKTSGEKRSGSWHFVTLPTAISKDIRAFTLHRNKPGFGSFRVKVRCGETEWLTSLFPSKEHEAYLLPVKKSVRMAEGLEKGKAAAFIINVQV